MFKSKLVLFSLASALTFTGCSKGPASDVIITSQSTPEVKKVTSVGVVNAQPQTAEIAAGETGEAVVRLVIQNGYHVNANPPTYPYLIATELKITSSEGITSGKVTYPSAKTGTFAFAEKPLAVYEGATELKVELKADQAAPKGNRSLPAVLRIQACDDQVCYPPGNVDLQIPVTIK
jgi:hypothetical protein